MPRSILMVDPDATLRKQVAKALKARGYDFQENADGREVLDQVRVVQPVVLILNVELPRGSGYALCSKLRKDEALKGIKVILTSAEATQKSFDDHRKLKLGRADDYLLKPYDLDSLVRKAMDLLGDAIEPDAAAFNLLDELEAEPEEQPQDAVEQESGEEKISLDDIEEIGVEEEIESSAALPGERDVDLLESAFQRLEEPQAPSDANGATEALTFDDDLDETLGSPLEAQANEVLSALESEPEERTVIGYPRASSSEVTPPSAPSSPGRDRDYFQVKDKLSQRERDLLRLREELNAREKEALEQRERETKFEHEVARKKEEVTKRDAQIRQLQQRIEALIAGQRRSERDLQASREEARSAGQRAEIAEQASQGHQRARDEELEQLSADLERGRRRVEELQTESDGLRARNQELEAEVTELRGQRSEIENEKQRDEERLVKAYDRLQESERIREKTKQALTLALQLLEEPVGDIDVADEAEQP
jgi:DNA-binding response OmpR family regulator